MKVCVFGASSPNLPMVYVDAAHELGREIALRGWGVINGGGANGLMRATSDGALEAGGEAIGIIPRFMVENGWHYDALTRLIETDDMHSRKRLMQEMSDAVVALPGGIGTFEELMEVLTWRQLSIVVKPIVILNTAGYYDSLLAMIEHAIAQGFIPATHRVLIQAAATPAEAVTMIADQLAHGVTPTPPKFHQDLK